MATRTNVRLSRIQLKNLKAFKEFSFSLEEMNILVGANNAGKSTLLNVVRALDVGLRRANSRRPKLLLGPDGEELLGWEIDANSLPMSLENIHTDCDDDIDTFAGFQFTNGTSLILFFPPTGGCRLLARRGGSISKSLRDTLPYKIHCVPTLGPVEKDERLIEKATVLRNLETHRASRHFRNYWHHFPDGFDDFAALLASTWPGMTVTMPKLVLLASGSGGSPEPRLVMWCNEHRLARELYWSGFGFQVWCQILTHVSSAITNGERLIVLDEPETYLHPELQRQLIAILRSQNFDVVMATHSTEIMTEVSPSELIVIDKKHKSARRLHGVDQVQDALDRIGSTQNIALTQLARNRKLLFVEGSKDFRILRMFARKTGMTDFQSGTGLTPLESEGFSNWPIVKQTAAGMKMVMGDGEGIKIAAIFDRDFRCEAEISQIEHNLSTEIEYAHIHRQKEIENYLLNPQVLQRVVERRVAERAIRSETAIPSTSFSAADVLSEILDTKKSHTQSCLISESIRFHKPSRRQETASIQEATDFFDAKWATLEGRLSICSGKDVLAAFRSHIQGELQITLTDAMIVEAYRKDEIDDELRQTLDALDNFRSS